MSTLLTLAEIPGPLGDMLVVQDAQGRLHALDWSDYRERLQTLLARYHRDAVPDVRQGRASRAVREALTRYFDGDLSAPDALAVAPLGSPFQRSVWQALRAIPPGTTTSYGALAIRLGRAGAARAVGLANGANPVGIVVPCHRVIGADGSLTGYGGGIERKRWLLRHEGVTLADDAQPRLL